MKILIFGCDGQLGTELLSQFQRTSINPLEIIALTLSGRDDLSGNFEEPEKVAETVHRVAPDVIINAAAYTAVDKAESDIERARLVNATAVGAIARAAKDIDALLIHYSTDYVFNGQGTTPFRENSPTGPLNVYGQTKLEGEKLVTDSGCRHFTFRTSWVYAAEGHNFIKAILKKAAEQPNLKVVNDQFGSPTAARLLAGCIIRILEQRNVNAPYGIYHLVAGGETTWFDYACFVVNEAHRLGFPLIATADNITPVSSQEFVTPAKRPTNSRLNTEKFAAAFGITLPDWREGVQEMLTDLKKQESLK